MNRKARQTRPGAETLEDRKLLSEFYFPDHHEINFKDLLHAAIQHQNGIGLSGRRFMYTASNGAAVELTVYGVGNLLGTNVGSDGALNLVYNGTNDASVIRGVVQGGHGALLPLASIRDADISIGNLTGNTANVVRKVNLPGFALQSGGRINLTGGVGVLILGAAAADSQINIRDIPNFQARPASNPQSNGAASLNALAGVVSGTVGSLSSNATTSGTGQGTSTTGTTTGTTGTTSAANNAGTTAAGTVNANGTINQTTNANGSSQAIPSGQGLRAGSNTSTLITAGNSSATVSENGQSYVYNAEPNGGVSLASVSGQFVPGPNLQGTRSAGAAGPTPAPPGSIIQIGQISGKDTGGPPLGAAQIYGYDPKTNSLIRFNTKTGAALQTIALPGAGSPQTGLGLARAGRTLVVLVGSGTTVRAFNASNGTPLGSFSTADLAASGLTAIDGIGSTETRTALSDSTHNVIQLVDVTASLASGQPVAVGQPFTPSREFTLSGGLTGLAGSNTLYATGAARFDTFQPDMAEFGVLSLNTRANLLAETARTQVSTPSSLATPQPPGTAAGQAQGLGSIEGLLALDVGLRNGANLVELYSPSGISAQGTVTLRDPNQLAGLSESFHPELAGTALVDVQGNLQSFKADTATGLILNDNGNLNLIQANSMTDSSIVGLPVGHIIINHRTNVQITSSQRELTNKSNTQITAINVMRDGVTVDPNIRAAGPLVQP